MANQRCYTDRRSGIHIPGCMGCATRGHENCTCPGPPPKNPDLEARIARLEKRIAKLEHDRRPSSLTGG
jgi:hypothetical protein